MEFFFNGFINILEGMYQLCIVIHGIIGAEVAQSLK
jgi:hypothetical protein